MSSRIARFVLAFTTGFFLACAVAQSARAQDGNPLFRYRLDPEFIPALNKMLPPLPDSMPTAFGWSRVRIVANPTCGIRKVVPGTVDGCTSYSTRLIEVSSGETRAEQWHTLLHELTHLMFFDTHTVMPPLAEEQLCDMIATWELMRQLMMTSGRPGR